MRISREIARGLVALAAVSLAACGDGKTKRTDDQDGNPGGAGGSIGTGGSGGTAGFGGDGGGGDGGTGGDPTGGSGGVPPIDVGKNLRLWGPRHGVSGTVWSVGADLGGNIWAANVSSLLLLQEGSDTWEVLNDEDGLSPYPILSVAGGEDLEVWVGYEGLFPDSVPFDDPPEIAKSGDVDRIRLRNGKVERFHYDISSPPSTQYPEGRDILRTCYRIVPVLEGPWTGDVWFGCNHGAAMWSERFQTVQEHVHPSISVNDSLVTGDFRGIAIAPGGDVWVGGSERTGLVRYAEEGGNFWARVAPELDVWPEGVSLDPDGHDWTMSLAADERGGLWVSSFGNGLAYRAADGSFSYFTTSDGLPENRIRDIAFDPDGSLWLATEAGLARMRGGLVVQLIDALAGLPGAITSVFVDDRTNPRRVIVGGTHGVGIYDGP